MTPKAGREIQKGRVGCKEVKNTCDSVFIPGVKPHVHGGGRAVGMEGRRKLHGGLMGCSSRHSLGKAASTQALLVPETHPSSTEALAHQW